MSHQHKPIYKRIEKQKVQSFYKDNIWGTDFADMQLIRKFRNGFRFLLFVSDMHGLFLWKTKQVRQLLMVQKKQTSLDAN